MSWSEQVFRYCERGQDPSLWAEPLNALSNAGFLIAAAVAGRRLAARRGGDEPNRPVLVLLVALVGAIGVGSLLFHTFATRWARLADVAPIGLFMVAYLVFALRAFLGWTWSRVGAALLLFLAANEAVAARACPKRLVALVEYAREPCLNETMSYLPALATLALVGALLRRRHPAGRALLIAAALFLVSLLLRWSDLRACPLTVLLGQPRGTHALWHLLNAATLYVLLDAALRTAGRGTLPRP